MDASYHRMAYEYSDAGWDSLRNHLTDVPWEDMELGASSTGTEFCEPRFELMYIFLIVNTRSGLIHLHGFQQLVLLP